MGFLIAFSTIPAAIVGFLLEKFIESTFSSLFITAIGFGITSMCLFIASLDLKVENKELSYRNAFLIGIAQVFAMLPGISRSGTTISSGLLLGLEEKKAVRFSFLMSIPVIFGAGLLELGNKELPTSYILPTFVSFFFGMITIHLLLKVLSKSRKNLRWFAVYTLLLSISIFIFLMFE